MIIRLKDEVALVDIEQMFQRPESNGGIARRCTQQGGSRSVGDVQSSNGIVVQDLREDRGACLQIVYVECLITAADECE